MKQFLLSIVLACAFTTYSSAQCVSLFYDGFESGSFSPTWVPGTGSYTNTVPSGTAAVGNYSLSMTSNTSNSFYQGLTATFTAGQPTYMSWWMRTNTTTGANGYVVVGDANMPTDNGVIFCYFNATSQLRFFASTGFNYNIVANTWYHVEARNMNWTTRTSDIYVNNVLVIASWPFRSTTATSVDRICLHSLVAATAQYDDFVIGYPPINTTTTSTSASCFGNSDGTATVTASGGTAPYTYSWAPSGGNSASAVGVPAGVYTCTITDANSCSTTATVTVTEPAVLTATTMQTNVSCFGAANGDAMMMVTGGTPAYTYSWGPTGGTNASASGLAPGLYTCYVTDAVGCQMTRTFNITEPAQALAITASNGGNVCPGDSAALTGTATGGTAGYTYNWMPGNLSGSNVTSAQSGNTTYTLHVTDANGCADSVTTTVNSFVAPVVSLGADTAACGAAMLDAQNAGGTYAWSEGSTTQTINVTTSGVYDVTLTDANGCMGMDTINVTINANPVVVGSASMNFVCAGEPTVTLFESPAGGTWNGAGVFGSTFEPDTAGVGTHDLVYAYTDSLGCMGMDTITITVDLCLSAPTEIANATPLNVYPNPSSGNFEILFTEEANDVVIDVMDAQGKLVSTITQSTVASGSTVRVDISSQAEGMYSVQIRTSTNAITQRIILQR